MESGASRGGSGFKSMLDRNELSLAHFVLSLRKRWGVALSVLVLTVSATAVFTFLQTPLYEAKGIIQFDPSPPRPLGSAVQSVIDPAPLGYGAAATRATTEARVMKGRHLAEAVVQQLGLSRDPAFISGASPGGETGESKEISVADAADILRGKLQVDPINRSHLVEVSYRDVDPVRGARILSALLTTYVNQNLASTVETNTEAGDWLQTQLEILKDELKSAEEALHSFKLTHNILSVSMQDQNSILKDRILVFSSELTASQSEEAKVASRLAAIRRLNGSVVGASVAEMLEHDGVARFRDLYRAAEQEMAALLMSNKGNKHPDVLAARSRMQLARDALNEEMEGIQVALTTRLESLQDQKRRFSELLNGTKEMAFELGAMEIDYNRLRRNRDNVGRLYGVVLDRSKTTDLTQMLRVNDVRVMESPVEPKSPVSPRATLNLAAGGLVGLMLALGAAFARERMDKSLKTPADVEAEIGLPVLGVLPDSAAPGSRRRSYYYADPLRRERRSARKASAEPEVRQVTPELVTHEHPMSGAAEAARALRTNILLMSPDKPQRSLLVTSARPREGKTTVACAVAISMAQAGQRVVLVDCDFRRPRLKNIFGMSGGVGVTSLLLEPSQLHGLDLSTQVPNLSVLSSGPTPPDPAELLHSAAFADLLKTLTSRFDRVVLDSPPVGPVTDAAILSTIVDGTLLVVRANQTHRVAALDAVRLLSDLSKRILGVVCNAVSAGPEYETGSGYNSYYGAYGGYPSPAEPRQESAGTH